MNKLPYVISAELEYVDQLYVNDGAIEGFRQGLDAALRDIGKDTLWIEASVLREGLQACCGRTALPVISLDQRYVTSGTADEYIGVSRAVDNGLQDAGYDARLGFPPLSQQFDRLGRHYGGRQVMLADDVLFSGEMLGYISKQLQARNVLVAAVACGIAIGDGIEKLAQKGIETNAAVTFSDIDDELCERDFTLLPGAGRKVAGRPLSAAYFDDRYGRPEQWASIPATETAQFCTGSLLRNLTLLRPDIPMPAFVGYGPGTVANVIKGRMS